MSVLWLLQLEKVREWWLRIFMFQSWLNATRWQHTFHLRFAQYIFFNLQILFFVCGCGGGLKGLLWQNPHNGSIIGFLTNKCWKDKSLHLWWGSHITLLLVMYLYMCRVKCIYLISRFKMIRKEAFQVSSFYYKCPA